MKIAYTLPQLHRFPLPLIILLLFIIAMPSSLLWAAPIQKQIPGAAVLDSGTNDAPSNWVLEGDMIIQKSNIWGGSTAEEDPVKPGTYLTWGQSEWTDGTLDLDMRSGDDDALGILLRYQDDDTYYRISMDSQRRVFRFIKKSGGFFSILSERKTGYEKNRWYHIKARMTGSRFQIFLDGQRVFDLEDTSIDRGKIGLYCWGNENTAFKNITLTPDSGPPLEMITARSDRESTAVETPDTSMKTERPASVPKPFLFSKRNTAMLDISDCTIVDEGRNDGPSSWYAFDGVLSQASNIWGGIASPKRPEKPGTYALIGDKKWQDFKLAVDFRSMDDGAIGVMFRYKDRNNYYRLSLDHQNGYRRLIKNVKGQVSVLAEDQGDYLKGKWNTLQLHIEKDMFTIFLNDAYLFHATDTTLQTGRIGLYCWGNENAEFKSVRMAASPAQGAKKRNDETAQEKSADTPPVKTSAVPPKPEGTPQVAAPVPPAVETTPVVPETPAPKLPSIDPRVSEAGYLIIDEGTVDGPSAWSLQNGILTQKSNIWGGENHREKPFKPGTLAIMNGQSWTDFSMRLEMKSTDDDGIGVVFRYQDPNNYYRLSLHKQRRYRRLIKKVNGLISILAEDNTPYRTDKWYQVQINALADTIDVRIDGKPVFTVVDGALPEGKTGLYSWGNQTSQFRHIKVDQLIMPTPEKPDHDGDVDMISDSHRETAYPIDLKTPQIIDEGTRDTPSFWHVRKDVLIQTGNIWGGKVTADDVDKPGTMALFGKNSWDDYTIYAKLSSRDDDELGIVFRFQDANNYYRVSMNKQLGYLRLIKKVDGTPHILEEIHHSYQPDRWYRFIIALSGNAIKVTVDNQSIFQLKDDALLYGKMGFYSWGNERSAFKDILVTPREQTGAKPSTPPLAEDKKSTEKAQTILVDLEEFSIVDDGDKNGPSSWAVTDGILNQSTNIWGGEISEKNPAQPGTYAIYGDIRLTDYEMNVALKSGDDDSIGVLFRYQDKDNYYRFSMNKQQNKRWLVKKVDGKVIVLAEFEGGYDIDVWYNITVKVVGKDITVFIDDILIADVQDNALGAGKIGMYCWGNEKSSFKKISLTPLSNVRSRSIRVTDPLTPYVSPQPDAAEEEIPPKAQTPPLPGIPEMKAPAVPVPAPPPLTIQGPQTTKKTAAPEKKTEEIRRAEAIKQAEKNKLEAEQRLAEQQKINEAMLKEAKAKREAQLKAIQQAREAEAKRAAEEMKRVEMEKAAAEQAAREAAIKQAEALKIAKAEKMAEKKQQAEEKKIADRKKQDALENADILVTEDTPGDSLTDTVSEVNQDNYAIVDEGTQNAPSSWSATDKGMIQHSNIWGGSTAKDDLKKPGTYVIWGDDWTDYTLEAKLRSLDDDEIGLMFRYRDNKNYYRFSMNSQMGYRRVIKVVNGNAYVLAEDDFTYHRDRWYEITIKSKGGTIQVFMDQLLIFSITDTSIPSGKIGLYCWANEHSEFNDISVIPVTGKTAAAKSSYETVDEGTENGPSDWQVVEGVLMQQSPIRGGKRSKDAILKPGTYAVWGETWTNHMINMDIRSGDEGSIGVMFRYTDTNNYYLFEMNRKFKYTRLMKKTKGKGTLLAEDDFAYATDTWYNLKISLFDKTIRVYLNDAQVFNVTDKSLDQGKICFYSWDNPGSAFKDVSVLPLDQDTQAIPRSVKSDYEIIDEGTRDGPSQWNEKDGRLIQTSNIWGDAPSQAPFECPGTILVWKQGDTNFSFETDIRSSDNDDIGIILRYKDPSNYYRFSMNSQKSYRRLVKKVNGVVTVLAEDKIPYQKDQWYTVKANLFNQRIQILADGKPIVDVTDDSLKEGKVGFYCCENNGAEFDNIIFSSLTTSPFRETASASAGTEPGKTAVRIDLAEPIIIDEGDHEAPSTWIFSNRILTQKSNIWGGSLTDRTPEKPGTFALYGEKEWQNYHMQVKLRSNDDDALGVMFRYQDDNNYYRFAMNKQQGYRRLIRKVNGEYKILAEDNVPYAAHTWYTLRIIVIQDEITIYVNGDLICRVEDAALPKGKIGLYSWGNKHSEFKDLTLDVYHSPQNVADYPRCDPMFLFAAIDQGSPSPGRKRASGNKLDTAMACAGYTIVDEGNHDPPSAWQVSEEGVLIQSSNIWGDDDPQNPLKPGTYALTAKTCCKNYKFYCDIRSQDDDALGIMFRYKDDKNYYRFAMNRQQQYRRLSKIVDGKYTVLDEDFEPYTQNQWYQVMIKVIDQTIDVFVDGILLFTVDDKDLPQGKIGLYTWGNEGSEFRAPYIIPLPDSRLTLQPKIKSEEKPVATSLSLPAAAPPVEVVPEFSKIAQKSYTIVDEGTNKGPSSWQVVDGILKQTSNIWGGDLKTNSPDKPGTYVLWGGDWENYMVSGDIKSGDDDALGVMFKVQDNDNYYRFVMNRQLKYRQLIKKTKGKYTVLAEDSFIYQKNQWYAIQITAVKDTIIVTMDGKQIFKVQDASLKKGKVGLYCWGNENSEFDNFTITPYTAKEVAGHTIPRKISPYHLAPDNYAVVDEGENNGPSSWSIVQGVLTQKSNIWGGSIDGKDPDKPGTYALYGKYTWKNYGVSLDLRSEDNDGIGVMIRYQDKNNYYRFAINHQENYCRVIKKVNGATTILARDTATYTPNVWFSLKITCVDDKLKFYQDGKLLFNITDKDIPEGKIGLYCWGNTNSEFKNIRVIPIHTRHGADTVTPGNDPLYGLKAAPPLNFPEKPALSPKRMLYTPAAMVKSQFSIVDEGQNNSPSAWIMEDGVVKQTSNIWGGDGSAKAPVKPGTMALWKEDNLFSDYTMTVSMKSEDNDAIGVLFGYQDSANYYRFSMDRERRYRRLIKKQDGMVVVLAEDRFLYEPGTWYDVKIDLIAGNIRIFMNDTTVFDVYDQTHGKGRVGLYAWGNSKCQFKDIAIVPYYRTDTAIAGREVPIRKEASPAAESVPTSAPLSIERKPAAPSPPFIAMPAAVSLPLPDVPGKPLPGNIITPVPEREKAVAIHGGAVPGSPSQAAPPSSRTQWEKEITRLPEEDETTDKVAVHEITTEEDRYLFQGFNDVENHQGDEDLLGGFEEGDLKKAAPRFAQKSISFSVLFEINGYFKISQAFNFAHAPPEEEGDTDWQGLSQLRAEAELDVNAQISDEWKGYISGKGFYDASYDLNGLEKYTEEVLDTYESDAEVKEAYLSGKLGEAVDLTIGRQVVVWGKSENIRVTDILNPLDLREPGLTDLEYRRLPLFMARLDYTKVPWTITMITVHENEFDELPPLGSDFFPYDTPQPSHVNPEEPEAGLAVNGSFSGMDISLYAASVFDDTGYIVFDSSGLHTKHPRVTMVGAAMNLARGNFLAKLESAQFTGIRYASLKKSFSKISTLAGLEYSGFRNTSICFEMASEYIGDFDEALEAFPDEAEENLILSAIRITRSLMNDTLTLSIYAQAYGIDAQGGAFERFMAEYDLSDAIQLTGRLMLYQSGTYPLFKSVGDNDRVYFDIRYSF